MLQSLHKVQTIFYHSVNEIVCLLYLYNYCKCLLYLLTKLFCSEKFFLLYWHAKHAKILQLTSLHLLTFFPITHSAAQSFLFPPSTSPFPSFLVPFKSFHPPPSFFFFSFLPPPLNPFPDTFSLSYHHFLFLLLSTVQFLIYSITCTCFIWSE